MNQVEWPDDWIVVSNDRGVWVKHAPSRKGWKVAPASALESKDDRLARTYRRVQEVDVDT